MTQKRAAVGRGLRQSDALRHLQCLAEPDAARTAQVLHIRAPVRGHCLARYSPSCGPIPVRQRSIEIAWVAIANVAVDNDGRLLVYPTLPDGETFEFIYRAARGARWDHERHFLYTEPPKTASYADLFGHILDAIASEYGRELFLNDDTGWQDVPSQVREAISALARSVV